jgi:hypothetical protein
MTKTVNMSLKPKNFHPATVALLTALQLWSVDCQL